MKRNMVPLLGIAFVVAIISTGVFYGLFAGKLRSSSDLPEHSIVVAARDMDRGTVLQASDVHVSQVQGVLAGAFSNPQDAVGATLLTSLKTNEPLLLERVTPRASEAAATAGRVPTGMRALSIRVSESESLLNFMLPGSRVDVQAVSEKPGSVQIRTVLENVQVLGVSPPDANTAHGAGTVVTVLVPAQSSDIVALADAGSRIRVALRNPLDEEVVPRRSLPLTSVFSASIKRDTSEPRSSEPAHSWDHPVVSARSRHQTPQPAFQPTSPVAMARAARRR